MPGKPLSSDDILKLLEGERKPSDAKPLPPSSPLKVLIQSDNCKMCLRENGPQVAAMYTVDGKPLCSPHAMYTLSLICIDNGYKVEIAGKHRIKELPGQL